MIKHIPIDLISANPFQPRKVFNLETIRALGESIKKEGLLQPIVVRPHPDKKGRYQLVAGECRWRGVRMMKLKTIKADVRKIPDLKMKTFSLLENMARSDMNPIDTAQGVKTLLDSKMTIKEISKTVGRTKKSLQEGQLLLLLPTEIQQEIALSRLSVPIGIAIAKLSGSLHMKAYKSVIGRTKEGAMNRIRIIEIESKEQCLFMLTPELDDEMQGYLAIWTAMQKASSRLARAHAERREALLSAICKSQTITTELELMISSLRRLKEEAGLLLTYKYTKENR